MDLVWIFQIFTFIVLWLIFSLLLCLWSKHTDASGLLIIFENIFKTEEIYSIRMLLFKKITWFAYFTIVLIAD